MNAFEKTTLGAVLGLGVAYAGMKKIPVDKRLKTQRQVAGAVVGGIVGYLWPDPTTCPTCPPCPPAPAVPVPSTPSTAVVPR